MNKKLLILLALILVVVPAAAACGRTPYTGSPSLAAKVPHPVDVRFENCIACHAADEVNAKEPFDHVALGYTNQNCMSIACHRLAS